MKAVGKFFNVINKVWDVLLTLVVVGLLLLRFGTIPFGIDPVVCLSNSMAPTFYEGSLCYIDTNYDVDSAEVGDIIAFELADGSQVTHRVHELKGDAIITKGDANEDIDISPISKEQIIGENVYQIANIGNLFRGFPNRLLISLVVFSFALTVLLDFICKSLEGEEAKNGKKVNKEETISSSDGTGDISNN